MRLNRNRLVLVLVLALCFACLMMIFSSVVTSQIPTTAAGFRGVAQELAALKADIVVLETKVGNLEPKVAMLESKVATMETDVAALKSKQSQLITDMVDLLEYEKKKVSWDQLSVNNRPDGTEITLRDDSKMLKEEWLTQILATVNDLQRRIDAYK